ncbi:hypothetical protein HanRHA438_Chr12g0569351 [Helianthus annuus]|nr:hypothetical protein HanRHA438_Chr12g0569351 [Helianthus annuus]
MNDMTTFEQKMRFWPFERVKFLFRIEGVLSMNLWCYLLICTKVDDIRGVKTSWEVWRHTISPVLITVK